MSVLSGRLAKARRVPKVTKLKTKPVEDLTTDLLGRVRASLDLGSGRPRVLTPTALPRAHQPSRAVWRSSPSRSIQ
jgi:hypothetical protein